MPLRSLITLLLVFYSALSQAEQFDLEFLRDSSAHASLSAVLNDESWRKIDPARANFGFTADAIWLRTRIQNPNDLAAKRLLRIEYPLLDQITAFALENNTVKSEQSSGDRIPYNAEQRKHDKYYLFEFDVPARASLDIYIRIESQSSMTLPVSVLTPEEYAERKTAESYWFGALYGSLIIMMLYNLVIAISIRSLVYYLYVGYMSGFIFLIAALNGDGFQYIWSDYPDFNNQGPIIGAVWPSLFTLPLAYTFLKIPDYSRNLARFYQCLYAILWICIPLLPFIDYLSASKIMNVLNMIYSPVILITAIYFAYKGRPGAAPFALAWLALAISLTLLSLSIYNIIPSSTYLRQAYSFGGLVELVIISLALARVINQSIRERNEALQESKTYLSNYLDIFNRSPAGIFTARQNGDVIKVNSAFKKILGYEHSDSVSINLYQDLGADSNETQHLMEWLSEGKSVSELPLLCKNKTQQPIWLSLTMGLINRTEPAQIEGYISDINDRILRQQDREAAEKRRLESMKLMIAGISHELNTPLGNNLTTLSFLEEIGRDIKASDPKTSESLNESIVILQENEQRIAQLVQRFKAVSTGYLQSEPRLCELKLQTNELLQKYRESHPDVDFRLQYSGPACLHTYEEPLQIIFEGLIENSLSHGLKGITNGCINIEISHTMTELNILFKDNGLGIQEEIREKIFEPFFTTSRGSIENSGLGLYAIENIVINLFHGQLHLEPGPGFNLRLTLPTRLE